MTQKQIADFFEQNPESTEAHEALGCLFADKEEAQKFIGGVHGVSVRTHTKGAAATAGQQSSEDDNTSTEGTETGSADSPADTNTNADQQSGTTENPYKGKSVEELKTAEGAKTTEITAKQAEITAAKGFGKKKPQAELVELLKDLALIQSAIGEASAQE